MEPAATSTHVRAHSLARNERYARGTRLALAVLALAAAAACSAPEETGVSSAQMDETTRLASTAADTATGSTDARAGTFAVGGDASTSTSVSIGLTANATFRAFTVCTGGGDVELDLAGTPQELTCDGQVREVAELVVPNTGSVQFKPSRVNDVASAWAVAFAPA